MRSLVLSHISGHLDDRVYKEYKYKLKLEVTQEHDVSTGETINKLYICNSYIFMFLEYIDNLDVVQSIINGKGIIQYIEKVLSLDECNELYPYLYEDSVIEVFGKNYRVFKDSMRLIESQNELEEVLEITKQRCYEYNNRGVGGIRLTIPRGGLIDNIDKSNSFLK